MDKIMKIANKYGLIVIEDAAKQPVHIRKKNMLVLSEKFLHSQHILLKI